MATRNWWKKSKSTVPLRRVKQSAAREASIASFRLQKTAETLLMDRFATSSARFRKSITERLQKRE